MNLGGGFEHESRNHLALAEVEGWSNLHNPHALLDEMGFSYSGSTSFEILVEHFLFSHLLVPWAF